MFSAIVYGFLLFAVTGIGLCQESVTADLELIFAGDGTMGLQEGGWFTPIRAFDNFTKVPGVTEDSATALLVESGKYAIFKRIKEEDGCLWELTTTSCPDQQITYTFWLNVQEWVDRSSTVFRAASTTEPGFLVSTSRGDENSMKISYNGDGIDYVVMVPKSSLTLQWTFLAVVIDGTTQNMKVYLNDTLFESSNGESGTKSHRKSEKPMSLGLASDTTTLYFADLKIYYTALDQTTLQNIYEGVVNGGAIPESTTPTTTTNATKSTTEGSTTSAPTVATTTEIPATTMETVTTASTDTTTTPPIEPSSTSSPVSCQTINAEWTESFADWEELRDEYSKAFEEWKENAFGCM